VEHLVDGKTEDVPVDGREAFQFVVLGVLAECRVDGVSAIQES